MRQILNPLIQAMALTIIILAMHATTSFALQYEFDYTYKGRNFDQIQWYGEPWPDADQLINTADYLTIEIKSKAQLPSSFSFYDAETYGIYYFSMGNQQGSPWVVEDNYNFYGFGCIWALNPISGIPISWSMEYDMGDYGISSRSGVGDNVHLRPEGTWDGFDAWAQPNGEWSLTVTTVPEPSTILLLGFGLAGIVGLTQLKGVKQS